MSRYPEHEKLEKVQSQSQACGEFIEWLQRKKKIHLCVWRGDAKVGEHLDYAVVSVQVLLAEFFEVDLDKLEEEKTKMLRELQRTYRENNNG